MIENGDYKFRDDLYNAKKGETVPIEILTWPYNGVIYRYSQVGVSEQEDGTANLKYSYELLQCGEHTETQLRKDEKFSRHLGILLNHLILESLENEVNANAAGEDHIEEPDAERTVRAKGPSISQE